MMHTPGPELLLDRHPYKRVLPAPIYWLYRTYRWLISILVFSGFWLGCVLVGWLWLPWIVLWPGTQKEKYSRALRTMQRGFLFFHFWMRLLRLYYRWSPSKHLRPPGMEATTPSVIICNHPTLVDVTSLVSLFPNVVAVARSGLANNPLFRWGARKCGFVPAGKTFLAECEERLRMGFDVLIFPEGTRTPFGGPINHFHRGAFELAARAHAPLVVVKLTCVPSVLSKNLPIHKVSDQMAVLTIDVVEVIEPVRGRDSKVLCREIEQRYQDMLGYSAQAVVAREPHTVGGVS
jgi:1-acyl-sn-glycerol-3-phosphate acyltransferase